MQTLSTLWGLGAGGTFMFIYMFARCIDWEKVFKDAPKWWSKFNLMKCVDKFGKHEKTYLERLAQHPITTVLHTTVTCFIAGMMLLSWIVVIVLWPITWSFAAYLYLRKLRRIRLQLQTQ